MDQKTNISKMMIQKDEKVKFSENVDIQNKDTQIIFSPQSLTKNRFRSCSSGNAGKVST